MYARMMGMPGHWVGHRLSEVEAGMGFTPDTAVPAFVPTPPPTPSAIPFSFPGWCILHPFSYSPSLLPGPHFLPLPLSHARSQVGAYSTSFAFSCSPSLLPGPHFLPLLSLSLSFQVGRCVHHFPPLLLPFPPPRKKATTEVCPPPPWRPAATRPAAPARPGPPACARLRRALCHATAGARPQEAKITRGRGKIRSAQPHLARPAS